MFGPAAGDDDTAYSFNRGSDNEFVGELKRSAVSCPLGRGPQGSQGFSVFRNLGEEIY